MVAATLIFAASLTDPTLVRFTINGTPAIATKHPNWAFPVTIQAHPKVTRATSILPPFSHKSAEWAALYAPWIAIAATQNGLDPKLLHAVIRAESNYYPHARSRAGAIGIMQLMPATAAHYGANPHASTDNILAGCQFLRHLLDRYHGNLALALAAYNAGEPAIDRHGPGIPPYPETINYVRTVLSTYLHDLTHTETIRDDSQMSALDTQRN